MIEKHLVDDKSMNAWFDGAIKCPNCGHSCHFTKVDKMICSYCGNYVFRNKKAEFEHLLKIRRIAIKNAGQ